MPVDAVAPPPVSILCINFFLACFKDTLAGLPAQMSLTVHLPFAVCAPGHANSVSWLCNNSAPTSRTHKIQQESLPEAINGITVTSALCSQACNTCQSPTSVHAILTAYTCNIQLALVILHEMTDLRSMLEDKLLPAAHKCTIASSCYAESLLACFTASSGDPAQEDSPPVPLKDKLLPQAFAVSNF